MDGALRDALRREGDARVRAARDAAGAKLAALEIVRERTVSDTLGGLEAQAAALLPLPELSFLSHVTAEDQKRWQSADARGWGGGLGAVGLVGG
eukprot:43493-Chlamydomonas_euryale.AAC.1